MPEDVKEPLRLVVVGDSTSFTGDRGPLMPTDPTVYPNVVRACLEEALERPVTVNVLARAGSDVRVAWQTAHKDRHAMFEVLMGADALIVGVGSIDHAPVGFPPVLESIMPHVRPASVRRRARTLLYRIHPIVARATGSRISRTPLAEFTKLYDGLLFQLRALTRGVPSVALGPTSHAHGYYGVAHPMFPEREQVQLAIARAHGFATVRAWPLVEPARDRLNPDSIHWPSDVHASVGLALAEQLIAQFRGEVEPPQAPTWP